MWGAHHDDHCLHYHPVETAMRRRIDIEQPDPPLPHSRRAAMREILKRAKREEDKRKEREHNVSMDRRAVEKAG